MDTRHIQALVVARALRVYAATGRKVNTAYTPKNMLAVAKQLTGQTFKAWDYVGAADTLDAWRKEPIKSSQA